MSEKETIFSSNIGYDGVFSFKDFYKFCHDWLIEEVGMDRVVEEKYKEKIAGDKKDIEVKWKGTKDLSDYFRFEMKVSFTVRGLRKVEITNGSTKIETNKGDLKLKVDGILIMDYKGKFETTPFNKFLRDIYQRWVITSRIEEFKEKIAGDCDEFLLQGKAYLDLEGKNS